MAAAAAIAAEIVNAGDQRSREAQYVDRVQTASLGEERGSGAAKQRIFVVRDKIIDPLDELLEAEEEISVIEDVEEEPLTKRQQLFVLLDQPESSPAAFFITAAILVFILISTVIFCVSSLPYYYATEPISLVIIESICVGVFTIEYGLKLITAEDKIAFIKAPLNLVDLFAIIPFYLELALSGQNVGSLAVIRVVRLTRVFRLFKLGKYSSGFAIVTKALVESLDALSLLFFLFLICVVFFSSMMFYADHSEGGYFDEDEKAWYRKDGNVSPFQSIPATFWWAIVTMTTVGYGDAFPLTTWGKLVATVTMVTGILVIAFPITIIGANFAKAWADEKDQSTRDKAKKKFLDTVTIDELMALLRAEADVSDENIALMEDAFYVVHKKQENIGIVLDGLDKALHEAGHKDESGE